MADEFCTPEIRDIYNEFERLLKSFAHFQKHAMTGTLKEEHFERYQTDREAFFSRLHIADRRFCPLPSKPFDLGMLQQVDHFIKE